MPDKAFTEAVALALMEQLGRAVIISDVKPVGGGSINKTARLETDAGFFFLKWNDAQRYPGMFAAEAKGLQLLAAAKAMTVPAPLATGEHKGSSFLVLDFLQQVPASQEQWRLAGAALAGLHRETATHFGLDHDNYIGSLAQRNRQHDSWAAFFAEERLLPQIKMAYDNQRISAAMVKQAERFCSRAEIIFPAEKPSLLHGDLWSGNFMFTAKGPAIFDPAVYYGHREMDLAMTRLFGGFDAGFYEGYEAEFPPEQKWRSRVDYCNLYPLLVHVNLFGGGYAQEVQAILRAF